MSPRRLALLALAVAALVPGAARAAVPAAIYPVRVPGLTAEQRNDLHALLKSALLSGERRGVLRPRTPLVMAAICGEPPAPDCLGRLAADGVVLTARGERRGSTVVLAAALYDRKGATTREVRFLVDLFIENLRPINDALAQLESELGEDGTVAAPRAPPPVAVARVPKPPVAVAPKPLPPRPAVAVPTPAAAAPTPAVAAPTPTVAAPTPAVAAPTPTVAAPKPAASAPKTVSPFAAIPLPPPPAALRGAKTPAAVTAPAASASRLDVSAPSDPPPVWRRQAGPFFTIVGGALVASGAAVAIANRSLANDLASKRTAGTLTAADRASYDKVDRYNVLSTVLLAGGGVSLAAGTWIWITAPTRAGEPALAVAGGRF